jgi:hypothetical protein
MAETAFEKLAREERERELEVNKPKGPSAVALLAKAQRDKLLAQAKAPPQTPTLDVSPEIAAKLSRTSTSAVDETSAAAARVRAQAAPPASTQKTTAAEPYDFYKDLSSAAATRGTPATDDPSKLTQHFSDLAGNTRAPITENDVTAAAQGGHSPDAQDRLFNIRETFNSPENQRALSEVRAISTERTRVENEAQSQEAGVASAAYAAANPEAPLGYVNGRPAQPSGPSLAPNGLASQSSINAANAQGWQALPSGGYARSTAPTVGELRQTLASVDDARATVAKRDQERQGY